MHSPNFDATTAHTFIIALYCCVRPNFAASGYRAVQINRRAVLFGWCESNYLETQFCCQR